MRKLTINHDPTKVFVTSDTHFGHRMISKMYRGFDDVDEHDRALVASWNRLVPEDGLVINFGDVSFANKNKTVGIINSLHGKKLVIPGNHDNTKNLNLWFGEENVLPQLLRIQIIDPHDESNRISFEASHYPLASWNGSDHGALHLHGHLHSRNNSISHHFCAPYTGAGVRYDVGIENAPFFGYKLSPIPLIVVRDKYEQDREENARRMRAERIGVGYE